MQRWRERGRAGERAGARLGQSEAKRAQKTAVAGETTDDRHQTRRLCRLFWMERVFSARCSTSRSSDRARLSASSSCSGANNLRPSGPAHASHVAHAVPTCACVLCRACRRAHASPLWTRAFAVRKADGAGEGERRGGRHIREELALKVAAFPRFRSDAQLLPSLLDSPARLLNSLAHLLHQLRVLLLVRLRCVCGASVLRLCQAPAGRPNKRM